MSANLDNLAKDLQKIISESDKRKTKGYDTVAEVVKVGTGDEEGIVWVRVPDGAELTPARKTIDAAVGHKVQVRIAGGKAWLTGNYSDPLSGNSYARTIFIGLSGTDERNYEEHTDLEEKVAGGVILKIVT